jgi:hypothetical protein
LPVALLRQHAHGNNPIIEADYKLCADLNGRVAEVSTLNILGNEVNEPIYEALRGWSLRPRPVGTCWLVSVYFRVDGGDEQAAAEAQAFLTPLSKSDGSRQYKNVPPHVLDSARISGDMPDLIKIQRRRSQDEVSGRYKVCIGTDGHVRSVEVVSTIDKASDESIQATVGQWIYKPQPIGICSMIRFVFNRR